MPTKVMIVGVNLLKPSDCFIETAQTISSRPAKNSAIQAMAASFVGARPSWTVEPDMGEAVPPGWDSSNGKRVGALLQMGGYNRFSARVWLTLPRMR
ncbi:hypothetical protein GCM10027214_22630 [Stenotrophomonas tumulicola]